MDDGRTDGRTTDGRTTEHGYTISSPCEPDGSGELTRVNIKNVNFEILTNDNEFSPLTIFCYNLLSLALFHLQ